MRNGLVLICVALLIVGVLAIAGCTMFSTHTSMREIVEEGWPADKAELDVVRISIFGGVSYSEETGQYAFAVYDKSVNKEGGSAPESIAVVVKKENIHFEPEVGDFLSIKGELQHRDMKESVSDYNNWYYKKKPMFIYATEVTKVEPPAGW